MRRAFRLRFGRAHVAGEIDDELAFHLEMRTQRLIAAGLAPDAARQEALRQFGDVDSVRRSCVTMDTQRERAMHRANLLDELRQDVVYALRTLRRNAGFTAVVVATLALGIGANTAIFTLINAVLLRSLPVPGAERLVAIGDPTRVGSVSSGSFRTDLFSYPLYRDVRDRNTLATGLVASGRTGRLDVAFGTDGEPEHPRGRLVSGNYFQVLGVPAALGRTFGAEEEAAPAASPVVVISHRYWTRRFAADPGVLGRTLTINGSPYTVIGVTPRGFTGEIVGAPMDIWLPLTMQSVVMPNRQWLDDRNTSWLLLLGRLAPGVTLAQAEGGFDILTRQVLEEYTRSSTNPDDDNAAVLRETVPVSSGARGFSGVRGSFYVPLLTLMAGVGLLLLIVCANVANLLLARAVARAREMSVRVALGAGRPRLVRQLLTESVLLAVLGAAAGLLVAWWGSRGLLILASQEAGTVPIDLRFDLPVLAFTAGVSLAAVALFGLAPALRASRVDLAGTMRAHARTVGSVGAARGLRMPLGKLLIVAQVALSLVLLVGAGLLVRSLRALQQTDPGLDRDHLLIAEVDTRTRGYEGERLGALSSDLMGRMQRLPGVRAATYSENGIFSGTENTTTLQVEGFTARTGEDTLVYYDMVGPGYVHAIGARLLQGRDFTERDDARGPSVAMVNETMARFYFPGVSALGKRLRFDSVSAEIVGVMADVKDHDLRGEPVRRAYLSYLQHLDDAGPPRFAVRAAGDPTRLVTAVQREIAAVDPTLRVLGVTPLSLLMSESLREDRLLARLAAMFGAIALLLAAVGLYGVMSYAIARRTSEIGLRVALGAQRTDVVRMVLLDALRVVMVGAVVGVPIALAAMRLLRSQLYGVDAADPVALGAAVGVLATSALLAVMLPALRASRVAPIVALRAE